MMTLCFLPNKPSEHSATSRTASLCSNRDYLISVVAFGIITFAGFGYKIVMILWVKLDKDRGGLGWDSELNGAYVSAATGVIVILFSFFAAPRFSKSLGIKKTLALLVSGMIPVLLVISWTYLLNGAMLWVSLIIFHSMQCAFTSMFGSFISVAIANSVTSDITGAAVGFSQSTASLTRAIASLAGAWIFGWSLGWDLFFPFDSHFAFIFIAAVIVVDLVIILQYFNPSIEKRVMKNEEVPLLEKNSV